MRSRHFASLIGLLASMAMPAHAASPHAAPLAWPRLKPEAAMAVACSTFASQEGSSDEHVTTRDTFAEQARPQVQGAVIPVQELPPAKSYALILAGLGALGFMRGRRL